MILIVSRSSRRSARSLLRRSVPELKCGITRNLHVSLSLLQQKRPNDWRDMNKPWKKIDYDMGMKRKWTFHINLPKFSMYPAIRLI